MAYLMPIPMVPLPTTVNREILAGAEHRVEVNSVLELGSAVDQRKAPPCLGIRLNMFHTLGRAQGDCHDK